MKKAFWLISLLGVVVLGLSVTPSEANFVQCPGGPCAAPAGTSEGNDLINGSPDIDEAIQGLGGDDIIFGNGSPDAIQGNSGNDIILGGLGADIVFAGPGDDIILPGPDTFDFSQVALGGNGNDTFTVLAGEIVSCLFIDGNNGNDVVNLVGFGPYSATSPFGIPDFALGSILIVDPITGGRIIVSVSPNAGNNTEVINGLPTPNPVYLTIAEVVAIFNTETGTDPCPEDFFGL